MYVQFPCMHVCVGSLLVEAAIRLQLFLEHSLPGLVCDNDLMVNIECLNLSFWHKATWHDANQYNKLYLL